MQAYNCEKPLFASVNGSTGPIFGEPAFRSLGYSQRLLTLWQPMRHAASANPATRPRALLALKRQVSRLYAALRDLAARPGEGYAVRQEYRLSWGLLDTLVLDDGAPDEAAPDEAEETHWPFWIFRAADVAEYIRWDVNQWLFDVCAALSSLSAPVQVHTLQFIG